MGNKVAAVLLSLLIGVTVTAQQLTLRGEPRNGEPGVDPANLIFEFDPIAGHDVYYVQLSPERHLLQPLAVSGLPAKLDDDHATIRYPLTLEGDAKLDPGRTYYWRVKACQAEDANCTGVLSDVRSFTTARTFSPFAAHWSLTKTIKGKTAKEPAKFAFSRSLDNDTGENDDAYTANFALQWKPTERMRGNRHFWSPTAYMEGVLNDHNDAADTAVRFGGGFSEVWTFGPGTGLVNDYTLVAEGDQDFDTRKTFAQGTFTIVNARLAMGHGRPVPGGRALWEPTIILAVGRTIDRGTSTETDETVMRVGAKVDVQILLDRLSELLNAPTTITVSDTGYWLPKEEQKYRNLLSAALDVNVAAGVTVGFEYNHGAEAPEFDRTHSLGLAVGLKF